ncbi:hypothetical protein A7X67_18970 [Clostridium sp. W14A]|uniref:NisI/SpaI family lantibiotic immunity lipoprotein n=1 Tax=Caproicibacter fermentans TaxID=2576756 RepID=UPI000828CACB|nr:NisI/SpaI family lantibiotic immunity lipoprotein [Caproicibacter fermentans]OCN02663.1 hypothetical protein A7X67_18970 [Clostridium sp. W14A]
MSQKIELYSSGKEECSLNPDNATQFTYKEKYYTILEDTGSKENLGRWVGCIRKLAVLDADGIPDRGQPETDTEVNKHVK